MTRLISLMVVALSLAVYAPADANAQLFDKIKKDIAKRAAAAREKADSTVVAATGKAADSALTKTNRGLAAGTDKVGSGVDTALNTSARAVAGAIGPDGPTKEQISAMLEEGRAVLAHIRFAVDSDQLVVTAEKPLRALADAMIAMESIFLIELYTDEAEQASNAGAQSELGKRRESAFKARLVAAKVPADRFFVRWGGAAAEPRVEVARAQ